jgi:hypothetical protein
MNPEPPFPNPGLLAWSSAEVNVGFDSGDWQSPNPAKVTMTLTLATARFMAVSSNGFR